MGVFGEFRNYFEYNFLIAVKMIYRMKTPMRTS